MNSINIMEIIGYCLPALITGGVAYYFFLLHNQNEEKRRNYLLLKENQNITLPVRLQAYERMVLFLERINIIKLTSRLSPSNSDKTLYRSLLEASIEQEFEHNTAQQIYVSSACWNTIIASKNATILAIRAVANDTSVEDAQSLREMLRQQAAKKESPSASALVFLKKEVQSICREKV